MLASGPRSGIGEIILPANEPGSSIMPEKLIQLNVKHFVWFAVKLLVMTQRLLFQLVESLSAMFLNAS